MTKLFASLAIAATALFPAVASAETSRGYDAHVTASGRVCLRPHTEAESVRLAIPIRGRTCQLPARWAAEGLKVQIVRPLQVAAK